VAAKRLGSALTNITGVAGQVLKVKSDESGFEFATPATIPAYTVTNKTVDRVINADDVTLDEVADVLATLIDDLAATGAPGGVQQVYTSGTYSHTGSNSGTQYTITHNFGSEPDYVLCQHQNSQGKWLNMSTVFSVSTNLYGFQQNNDSNNNLNTCLFTVYRDEVYDTTPTTIRFICAKLGATAAITPFQWSTSEQVWPFEKTENGDTLYCQYISLGALPNSGLLQVSPNSPISNDKVFKIYGRAVGTAPDTVPLPFSTPNSGYNVQLQFHQGKFNVVTGTTWSGYTGYGYVIYWK
jgi:hypothetical protein